MPSDAFYATMKLVTGEEVLAEICLTEEEDTEFFVVSNPITVQENSTIDQEKGVVLSGLVPKKWMTYANDDLTIIHKEHIISISEMDKFGIEFYHKALVAAKVSSPIKRKISSEENSGYVGTTESTRRHLQKIFDESPDIPE